MRMIRWLITPIQEELHFRADRTRLLVYAREVERQRDGLPPFDFGLALAWADLLDSLAGRSSR